MRLSPVTRLAVIFYVVLLHAWVTYVLIAYRPEMHVEAGSGSIPQPH